MLWITKLGVRSSQESHLNKTSPKVPLISPRNETRPSSAPFLLKAKNGIDVQALVHRTWDAAVRCGEKW